MTETGGQDAVESGSVTFRKPPVGEVSLAVSFEPLEGMSAIQIARLHERRFAGAGFSTLEEKPPVALPVEQFGRKALMPDIRFELLEAPPAPRLWFINKSGTELVQLQRDFFARNWRRREEDLEYRRYPSVRQPFEDDLRFLAGFIETEGLGSLKPVQCELTYVNEIRPVAPVWADHGDLSAVVRIWNDQDLRTTLPKAEEARFEINVVMTEADEPFGRLRISMQPAFRAADDSPVFLLTLTARGQPLGYDLDGVLRFMDFGHDWIVRTFRDLTTRAMHEIWEIE